MRHSRSTPRSLRSLSSAGILKPSLALTSCCVLWTLLGCSSGTDETPAPVAPGDGTFESADPGPGGPPGRGVTPGGGSDFAGGPATPPSGTPTAGESAGDGAGRAIEEADIIKLEGSKLYALSQHGGLSVIDVTRRDRLQLVGRHKITATPFEMYVRNGIVMALYNGYGEYSRDSKTDQWTYHQTSYVIAIDARVPSSTSVIGRYAVPGSISDSRIVGDVLYVAAFENGSCWGCGTAPRTNLISLNVANPAAISKVDELSFAERLETQGYSWKRSVAATDERLYIAGPVWGPNEPIGSTIQVVDISDRTGNLEEGATVKVEGQIESRWQMDEHAGVLRVVSQPLDWRTDLAPSVQTFEVVSSADIRPLGQVFLKIPRNERLRSARFDGLRGYAITAEQTDPLFTIDLSNPRLPRQAGELVMPGWVYHMEPQGERLLGLGFDQGNAAGALTVSLFDVSNLETPTMLSRVNFGGDWASLAEDQDRIHKAFNVLPDAGLLLVPFAGWSHRTTTSEDCGRGSSFQSGVQLIDWADDQLALRGVAPAKGQARRGFIHDERLFTMSDERIEAFDITDRDSPVGKDSLPLAQIVNHSAVAGDQVLRIGHDWWTNSTELDITSVNAAHLPSAYARLELPALDQSRLCYASSWLGDVYSSANAVHLVYQKWDYQRSTGFGKESTQILSVDTQDPSAPKLVGDASLDFTPQQSGYGNVWDSGKPTVMVGSTMVMANRRTEWDVDYTKASVAEANLKLVDLQDPREPVVSTVQLPRFVGATGLLVSGSVVATSHVEPVSGAATGPEQKVRFYLDRLDFSDPAQPRLAPSVNIPGSLLAFDAASAHAITVDYAARSFAGQTAQQCAERYGGWLEYPSNTNVVQETLGLCHSRQQTLHLVAIAENRATIVDSHSLMIGEAVGSTALGDDRLFVLIARSGGYYGRGGGIGVSDSGFGPGFYGFSSRPLVLLTLEGIRSGTFAAGRLVMEGGDSWGGYLPLQAAGKRAVLATGFRGKLSVVDAVDASAPTLLREVETFGYVQDLDIIGQTAVASMGHDGVQTIRLDD